MSIIVRIGKSLTKRCLLASSPQSCSSMYQTDSWSLCNGRGEFLHIASASLYHERSHLKVACFRRDTMTNEAVGNPIFLICDRIFEIEIVPQFQGDRSPLTIKTE